MDKNKLLELTKSGEFISGIFNYCDRWCEKCSYTNKCLNYHMLNERLAKRQNKEEDSAEDMLNDVRESFALAHEIINDYMEKENIKLDTKELYEIGKREKQIFNKVNRNKIIIESKNYFKLVLAFFKQYSFYFGQLMNKVPSPDDEETIKEREAAEIIMQYQMLIYTKLARAIHELYEDEDDYDDEYDDKLVSARIAIVSIEKSIASWQLIHDTYPTYEEEAKAFITMLSKIRKGVDKLLPKVVNYKRPYFD